MDGINRREPDILAAADVDEKLQYILNKLHDHEATQGYLKHSIDKLQHSVENGSQFSANYHQSSSSTAKVNEAFAIEDPLKSRYFN